MVTSYGPRRGNFLPSMLLVPRNNEELVRKFPPCYIATSGKRVAVEHLWNPEHGFGIFGDTEFRQIRGKRVLLIEEAEGGPRLQRTPSGELCYANEAIAAMLLPHAPGLADMATRAYEAAHDGGELHFVLGPVPCLADAGPENPCADVT